MLKSTYSVYRYLTCEKYSNFGVVHKTRCVDLKFKRLFNFHDVLQKKTKRKIPLINNKMKRSRDEIVVISSSDDEDYYFGEVELSTSNKAECKPQILTNFRNWECLASSSINNPSKFKIVSYNILAQHALDGHPHLYEECPSHHLDWKKRCDRLLSEIIIMDADILCLQEVQTDHLKTFNSCLKKLGYQYVFKSKTGLGLDGCAIFFKESIFKIEEVLNVEFKQPNFALLNRDHIGLLVKLAHRDKPGIPIVVATTHLLYNPRRAGIRLAQMQLLLAEIDRFAFHKQGSSQSGHLPIILTGDLNSTSGSEVIKLLSDGQVFAGLLRGTDDWERLGITDNCQHLSVYLDRRAGRRTEISDLMIYNTSTSRTRAKPAPQTTQERQASTYSALFNASDLWQTLQLLSVYDRNSDDSTKVTTLQDRWVRVDYIFYSRHNNLRLTKRMRLPTAEECAVLHLPNEMYGSDHLAVGAVFEITSPETDGR